MSPIGRRLARPTNWGRGHRVHQEAPAVMKNRKNDRIPHIYKHIKTLNRKGGGKIVKRFKSVTPKKANSILPWWLEHTKIKQNLVHENSSCINQSDIVSLWKRKTAIWVGREKPTMAIFCPKRILPMRGLAWRAGNHHLHATRFKRQSPVGHKDVKRTEKGPKKVPKWRWVYMQFSKETPKQVKKPQNAHSNWFFQFVRFLGKINIFCPPTQKWPQKQSKIRKNIRKDMENQRQRGKMSQGKRHCAVCPCS